MRNGATPQTRHPAPGERWSRWYALYTRARHERKVDRLLHIRGFEVYVPLVPRERQWHDRRKVVDWPLFPGYVFARFTRDATAEVLATPGVTTVVRQNGAPAPISDHEIESVRLLAAVIAETGEIPVPEPEPLVRRGQPVQVVTGPFSGVHGLVVQRRGGGRTLIQIGVDAIGQGLKVEVEESKLRALDGAA